MLTILSSCEDFLNVDPPDSSIERKLIFEDDVAASTAIAGLYLQFHQSGFASGDPMSIVSLAGLSADELRNNLANTPAYLEFQNNNINPENTYLLSLWTSMYSVIYQSNGMLEGLNESSGITPETRDQLRGEALFIRAFCYFYLVNCFGDVPTVLSTEYKVNASVSRTDVEMVYDQIESDLLEAEDLLTENYVKSGRARANKFAATAMLARLYLYKQDWPRAEDKASNVISKTTIYSLNDSLKAIFLETSSETILQNGTDRKATNQGYTFGLSFAPANNVLNKKVIKVFEDGDKRLKTWIAMSVSGQDTLYLPFKYKVSNELAVPDGSVVERSVVLRLAELYLIRAEARARQNKLPLAMADIDEIRERAGVSLIQNTKPGIGQQALIDAIIHERRLEFMAEWGHRWFDIKRLGISETVLAPIKSEWTSNDELYPVPAAELRKNKNLYPQNEGY